MLWTQTQVLTSDYVCTSAIILCGVLASGPHLLREAYKITGFPKCLLVFIYLMDYSIEVF